jgi:hypothetical protein
VQQHGDQQHGAREVQALAVQEVVQEGAVGVDRLGAR